MKPKTFLAVAAGGFFLVAFARNGTLQKFTRQVGKTADVVVGGYSKTSRRI